MHSQSLSTQARSLNTEAKLNEIEMVWTGRHENNQTTINIIRQFKHWYNEERNDILPQSPTEK